MMPRAGDRSGSRGRVVVLETGDRDRAAALAQRLDLDLVTCPPPGAAFVLAWAGDRLEIRPAASCQGAVHVDFVQGPAAWRRRTGTRRGERIARAVGLHRGALGVIDATAGLGRDAFVLAALGATVTALEREPVAAALLEDGLRRAAADPYLNEIVPTRLRLVAADAVAWLRGLADVERPDVVYLDPMFPPRTKSARVKKDMFLFQQLIGPEPDPFPLVDAARRAALRRVVIKRPASAPPLHPDPDLVYKGRTARFDVYLQ